MQVILKKDIEKLGAFGEVINVSDGYARNYLLPRGLVWPAEEKYLDKIKELQQHREAENIKEKQQAEELAEKIKNTSVTVEAQVGEDEKLFGSVTAMDIQAKLKESGIDIAKKDILIKEPIKALGVYNVSIKIHAEVEAECKVWVVKSE